MPPLIMVIEATPDLRAFYAELLTDAGYQVSACDSGMDDLAAVQAMTPDAVLLDGMFFHSQACLDLITTVRATPHLRRMGIIVCTAAVQQVARMRAQLQAMQVTIVFQPFEIDTVLDAIHQSMATAACVDHVALSAV